MRFIMILHVVPEWLRLRNENFKISVNIKTTYSKSFSFSLTDM